MQRHIKKMAEQQAIRATSTTIMSSWLTNNADTNADSGSTRLNEDQNSNPSNVKEQNSHLLDDLNTDDRTAQFMDKDTAPLSPAKDAGLEPFGMEEWISRKTDTENQVDSSDEQTKTIQRRHRRLVPAEVSESDSEDAALDDNGPHIVKDNSVNSSKYVEDVVETNKESDQSDNERSEGSEDENSSSESEKRKSPTRKVDIADFDDEEEFLLAGGEIEDAKKKKEWGLHQSDEEDEKVDEDAVISSTKDVSVSKENLRKLHRESERLLRERRCMIRPAPVQRRSFGDLIQKISARASNLEKSKDSTSTSGESETKCTNLTGIESFKSLPLMGDRSQLDLQSESVSPPPNAPGEECVQASSNPVGLNEEDEDDEELVIINTHISNFTPKVDVPKKVEPAPAPNSQQSEKKSSAAGAPRSLTAFSPPANNAKKIRMALLDSFRKTAQLRSEHLPKAVSSLQSKLKSETSLLPDDSTIMKLDAVNDRSFIPSNKFTGSKQGYIYKLDVQGLGYYPDVPRGLNSSRENNLLPPPIEDLPDEQKLSDKTVDEEEGESQPFGLEAGEELVLEYDEDGEGESMPICSAGDGMEADSEPHRPAAVKPLRTYAKKDKSSTAELEDQLRQPDSSSQLDADDDLEASDSKRDDASVPRRPKTFINSTAKMEKDQLKKTASLERQSDDESMGDADDEEDNSNDDGGEDSSDEAEETGSEGSDSSDGDESEEIEEKSEAAPAKKTLADITSIKRQTTLRLGTMEAGYLRTEQEALGIHDDIGVAEEDLGEGIDLDDTDGEDDSDEDNSEAERQVAEGFLEDAKYAGEVNPDLLRQVHMDITDKDEKLMTEKILDVVRGEARRRKAARENDDWIPNRGARVRLQNGGDADTGDADRPMGDDEDDALEDEEEEAARIASVLAKERLERLRFMQLAKESQKELESSGDEAGDSRQAARPVPMVRKVSCAVPSLAEFGSKFAGGGLVRSVSGCQANNGFSMGRPQLKRGSSLLGSATAQSAELQTHQQAGPLVSGKVFFFDTKQRSTDTAAETVNSPEPVSISHQETPMTRKRSDGGWNMTAAKVQRIATPMQRSISVLRENLDNF